MKSLLPFLSAALIFTSCTTAYKTGQTPDDVYFSPQRPQAEYVQVEDNNSNKYRYQENDEDRYLRMKVRNRRQWSDLNYYYSDPYAYNYYYRTYNNVYLNNPWNNYSYWNYYYNPYGPQVIFVNPKAPVYNKPRQYNLNVFDNNRKEDQKSERRTRVFDNNDRYEQPSYSAPRNSSGSNLRNVFGNSSDNSPSRLTSTEVRSQSSSSSNNSGSRSETKSSNAPVRKF